MLRSTNTIKFPQGRKICHWLLCSLKSKVFSHCVGQSYDAMLCFDIKGTPRWGCASSWDSGLMRDAERQIDISTLRCHKCHRGSTVPLTIVDKCQYQAALPLNHRLRFGWIYFRHGECNTSRQHFLSVIIPCIDCELSRHYTYSY